MALLTILTLIIGAVGIKYCMHWYSNKCAAAEDQYRRAKKLLRKWQAARPFLKVAACAYSRALVCEMIDAYRALLDLGAATDHEHLQYLRGLLNQGPNPYDPITFGPAESRVISLQKIQMLMLELTSSILAKPVIYEQ